MAGGLPPKPYVPPTAPAPPLPAGPAPQATYNAQDPAAAHAAAWAAYYQAQGLNAQGQPIAAAGYNANQPQQPQQAAGASSNPYANYGYGAQAAQAHLQQPQQGYRPPATAAPQQGYQYPQAGYASPAPYQAGPQGYGGAAPGYSQPQQGYQGPAPAQGWGAQAQAGPQQAQGYRPPQQYNGAPTGPQQPYFNGAAGPQQPYTPPHPGGQTPYRHNAGHSPAPMSQNRPYQPQSSRPPRPPMNMGPTPPHHPPAKRPRFDGPGQGPPTHLSGPGRASLPVRPGTGSIPARPPSGPRTPLPPPPITRPPIHLGTGGPPPVFAPGGPRGGSGPMRGMSSERGRGRGGMVMNAPRGPSHMRRERNQQEQRQRSARPDQSPGKKDRKDKKKEKEKDSAKTTLTDFRIVGIEMKELGWSWGLVGEAAMNQIAEEEVKAENQATIKDDAEAKSEALEVDAPPAIDTGASEEVKSESKEAEAETEVKVDSEDIEAPTADTELTIEANANGAELEDIKEESTAHEDKDVEGKVGGKRKAQSPETDEGSSKKRSTYLLTHGKTNELPSHENNSNRFRIYFESPPEADRIPQALRRNPYKRWRREDSAVPQASRPDKEEKEEGKEEAAVTSSTEEAVDGTAEVTGEVPSTETAAGEDAMVAEVEAVNGSTEAAAVPSEPVVTETTPALSEQAVPAMASDTDANATSEPVDVPEAPAESTSLESDQAEIPTKQADENVEPEIAITTDVEVSATDAEAAPIATEPPKEDELPIPSDDTAADAADLSTSNEGSSTSAVAAPPASAEETAVAIAQSAENAASAYKSRTRRRSSVSSTDSRDTVHAFQPEVTPSMNRLSILYEGSQRRMCFDAEVVEKIKVYREQGRIEVVFAPLPAKAEVEAETVADGEEVKQEGGLLPKGYLLEEYNQEDQRFAPVSRERLQEIYATEESTDSIPPLHRHFAPSSTSGSTGLHLSVYLNQKNPLSVPRWCRHDSADEWLYEQFGSRHEGWRQKLQVMDPDPPPTLASILENWSTSSSAGSLQKRGEFTSSLLSEPYDLLEILLRLTRGDRNPTAMGPLATSIRSDSPYASHQTHVSLAILAMYRLTTDYAAKAGEKSEVVNEKIGDIIKSLPGGMISRSLDGMFKEWDGKGKDRK